MDKRYNLGILEALFKDHLIAGNKSKVTIKCYLSDIRHFLRWIEWQNSSLFESSESPLDAFIFLAQPEVIEAYFDYLRKNDTPEATVKRRWFPIQTFFLFCVDRSILGVNPAYNMRSTLFPEEKQCNSKCNDDVKNTISFANLDYYNRLDDEMKREVNNLYSDIISQI